MHTIPEASSPKDPHPKLGQLLLAPPFIVFSIFWSFIVQQGLTLQVTALISSHRRILRSTFVSCALLVFCKKFGVAADMSKFALSNTSVQRDLSGSSRPENDACSACTCRSHLARFWKPWTSRFRLRGSSNILSLEVFTAYVCGCHGCHFIV